MEDYQQIAFQKLSSIHAYTNNMDYHMHNFYEIYLIYTLKTPVIILPQAQ